MEWPGALYALQNQLGLNVHPGGKTGFELKGYAHYLPSSIRKIFLYGTQGLVLPTWFKGDRLGVEITLIRTNLFPVASELGLSEFKEKDLVVKISAPERAAMEMLHLVPGKVGFDEAFLIILPLIYKEDVFALKEGRPRWDLLALEGLENLPAVKWKLLNISRMDPTKHQKAVNKLKYYLGL